LPQRLVAHPNVSVSVQDALIYLNNAREGMGSFERSFDNGVRRAVTGRTRQVNRAGANDRYRRE